MQKLRGTEKRSVYPISLYFKYMKSIPVKEIFRGMIYKDILPKYNSKPIITIEPSTPRQTEIEVKDIPILLNAQSYQQWNWSDFAPTQKVIGLTSQSVNEHLKDKVRITYEKKPQYKNRFDSFKGDVRDLPGAIFSRALDIIVMGVCRRNWHYVLPRNVGEIRMVDVSNSYAGSRMFVALGLSPEQTNHTIYKPCLSFYKNKKERTSMTKRILLHTSSHYNNTLRRSMFTAYQHKYENTKELTTRRLVNLLRRFYWDVPKDFITHVLNYGFKMYRFYSQYNISIVSKRPKLGKSVAISYAMVATRTRFFNNHHRPSNADVRSLISRMHKKEWRRNYSGYYFVALTEREFLNLKSYILINKKHYALCEHAMIDPIRRPHIIAVKTPKPLYYLESFRKNIDYEKNDIKHIWSWDGSRFRTTYNPK